MSQGTVRTRCRWGTAAHTVSAMKAPSMRLRRWWQLAQRPRYLQHEQRANRSHVNPVSLVGRC